MSLQTITAQSEWAVELPEVKDHLREASASDDAYIQELIYAAQAKAEEDYDLSLNEVTYDLLLDDFPLEILIWMWPIQSITSVKYTDDKKGVLAKEEDLLIVWDGANAGTIGYGKKGFIGSTIAALKKLDPVQYNTEFLGKFLQSKFSYLRSRATGAAIPHMNRKVLETLKIPIFEISDQISIASLLSSADELIAKRLAQKSGCMSSILLLVELYVLSLMLI